MNATYSLSHLGRSVPVAPSRAQTAKGIDTDEDLHLTDQEICDFYAIPQQDAAGSDRAGRLHENKWQLRAQPNPDKIHYRSSEQVAGEMLQLQDKYPDLCQRVQVGTSTEGRPIWALRVTADARTDTSHKTAVVITGCHHAREWMTVEVPMHTAIGLLDGGAQGEPEARRRLENAEMWFVPVVNPDGLEHSREVDNMWRKTRSVVDTVVDGQRVQTFGVDLNRNFWDGNAETLSIWRPAGDQPGTTADDFEAGVDNPHTNVFRGLAPASEPETQAMQQLKLGRPNVRGALDYHSFGEAILYAHGHTAEPPPEIDTLVDIAKKINDAAGGNMRIMSSAGFYPISGGALDFQHVNGVVAYTMEINGCFQPDRSHIVPTCERFDQVNLKFIDEIVARAQAGELPARTVPERYRSVVG
jgi:carboxypeptidase T